MKTIKSLIALTLSAVMICAASGCASGEKSMPETAPAESDTTEATAAAAAFETILSPEAEESLDIHGFEGVLYAVRDGQPVASYAKGTLENGGEITLDSPMPLGSVSKQFCAAAILLLQEQGKLSVSDTLDKYYPEYGEGKNISIHNLLAMRAGIPEPTEEAAVSVTTDNTEEQNVAAIKEWLFAQPLISEPDEAYAYSNASYFLLADIAEQVSGKKYIDFLRESFFTPLGMTHTGSIIELSSAPEWTQGITYQQVDLQPGITKGCGDLISNAADVTVWLNALAGGKVISDESFKAMTTDYSPESPYGYGLYILENGVGHAGAIGIYSAYDYISTDKAFTMVLLSNTIDPTTADALASDLLMDLEP